MSGADEEVAPPPSPSPPPPPPPPPLPPPDEMECKICYQRYNLQTRRPKVLLCLHRVCARCLARILDAADVGSLAISCPFCRHETGVCGRQLSELPDDADVVCRLSTRDKSWSSDLSGELLLTPGSLAASPSSSASSPSRRSSDCLVITIVDVPGEAPSGRDAAAAAALVEEAAEAPSELYTEQSLDSMSVGSEGLPEQDVLSKACTHLPRVLVWLLGFFYLSSLPLGLYLLVIQRVTLGVVCVSLVPSSLTVCLVYGICLLVPLPGRE